MDWTAWCDERTELAGHGFVATAKYPTVPLASLPPATLARLAIGLRDLCRLARSLCLAGAAAAGVPAIETVYPAFRDLEGLAVTAPRLEDTYLQLTRDRP